jgi:hypothetical protein
MTVISAASGAYQGCAVPQRGQRTEAMTLASNA